MAKSGPGYYPSSLQDAVQKNCVPQLVSFYGHTLESFTMPMHAHPQLEIMYAVTGSCRIPLGQGEAVLHEGDFIFLDALAPHRLLIEPGHPCRVYMLEILCQPSGAGLRLGDLASGCPQLTELARQGHPQIILHDSGELYPIISQLQQERENHAVSQDHIPMLTALFTCLFIGLARCLEHADRHSGYGHVRRAMQYIQDHYDHPLSVGTIAQAAGVHPAHLQRLFQRHRQQSVYCMIGQLRLEKACMLLLNSSLPIIDVAVSAGFNSRQNFGLAFSKMYGLAPGEFRRQRGNQAISPGERVSIADEFYIDLPESKQQ